MYWIIPVMELFSTLILGLTREKVWGWIWNDIKICLRYKKDCTGNTCTTKGGAAESITVHIILREKLKNVVKGLNLIEICHRGGGGGGGI